MEINEVLIKIRRSDKYKEWRETILKRKDKDDLCRFCGKNKFEHIHHIIPIREIVKEKKIIDLEDAYKCDILWDIKNGIKLCQQCHSLMETGDLGCALHILRERFGFRALPTIDEMKRSIKAEREFLEHKKEMVKLGFWNLNDKTYMRLYGEN